MQLTHLVEGQQIPYGGDRVAVVSAELAESFRAGDRLVVVHATGDLLHIPASTHQLVTDTVDRAVDAFRSLASVSDEQITEFFVLAADLLGQQRVVAALREANAADADSARARGRGVGRLALTDTMLNGMIDGLRTWAGTDGRRNRPLRMIDHAGWSVEEWRAPLGVVGFVFEGRPNVFADACGVLRTGNTAVLRIGSDALGTARVMVAEVLEPALHCAGLPAGAIQLLDSAAHAGGWALFSDTRLSLAVARGSGPAVAQLGAVARQHGVAASLHGTGGAWIVAATDATPRSLAAAVRASIDRKVCNTLNVCCVTSAAQAAIVIDAARSAAAARNATVKIHEVDDACVTLGHEFEWDTDPEFWLVHPCSVGRAVALFNDQSPQFVASLVSEDADAHDWFYRAVNAPFVGTGMTRWVDGQWALDQPELGLSNWQGGRLLARSGVLSGDSVFTIRLRAVVHDDSLHR
jgi:glutamate-5-semialdehyde dehydrogenase